MPRSLSSACLLLSSALPAQHSEPVPSTRPTQNSYCCQESDGRSLRDTQHLPGGLNQPDLTQVPIIIYTSSAPAAPLHGNCLDTTQLFREGHGIRLGRWKMPLACDGGRTGESGHSSWGFREGHRQRGLRGALGREGGEAGKRGACPYRPSSESQGDDPALPFRRSQVPWGSLHLCALPHQG